MINPKVSEVAKYIPTIRKHDKVGDETNNCEQVTPSTTMTQNFEVANSTLEIKQQEENLREIA